MLDEGRTHANDGYGNWRRAIYVACQIPDASEHICRALRLGVLEMFVECSANNAHFNPVRVANGLLEFYRNESEGCNIEHDEGKKTARVELDQDYLYLVKTPFLRVWAQQSLHPGPPKRSEIISLALSLSELYKRNEVLPELRHSKFSEYQWSVRRLDLGKSESTFSSSDFARRRNEPNP
jgi:hypothetical protein